MSALLDHDLDTNSLVKYALPRLTLYDVMIGMHP